METANVSVSAVLDTGTVIYRLKNQANLKLVDFVVHNIFFPEIRRRKKSDYSVNLVHYYDVNLCSIHSFSGFCPDLHQISNGRVIDTSPSIHQPSVEFRCDKNFRLVGRSRLECIDGRWNGKLPFCESKSSLQSIVSSY